MPTVSARAHKCRRYSASAAIGGCRHWPTTFRMPLTGAAVNFADIDRDTLCIDPNDIEHRIGPRTKAIVPVHYAGHPADMDPIMEIADRHNIKVIEDVSHAHGALYKGRMVGTIGHIACMSMMAGKSFAIGEAGMMVTNDHRLYERCISFGHYERTGVATTYNTADSQVTANELLEFADDARPVGDESIAEDAHQLFALCRENRVNHLIYAGFAINWCLLLSPGGMADMSKHGIMCSAPRQAVTAVENKETARSELCKELGLWRVAVAFGYVFDVDDFINALGAR
ncbi:MAG: DegT/DnrJ/EryC1/StrS family aminotransferase [Planctomycetes bacterium]|nr:DegT/DnrJ/EryC1/StrS family aminotransferase [Planctomycetota bacterium]